MLADCKLSLFRVGVEGEREVGAVQRGNSARATSKYHVPLNAIFFLLTGPQIPGP